MKHFLPLMGTLLAILSTMPCFADIPKAREPDCLFTDVGIALDMPRAEAEQRIALALGRHSTYAPNPNNLPGGTFTYLGRGCTLKIIYKAGTPAPLVNLGAKNMAYLLVKDESVLAVELINKASSVPLAMAPARP